MNERLIFEDNDFKSTYFFDEDSNLVIKMIKKSNQATYYTIYETKQAHKAAKRWSNK